ncbi:MAG: PIN domain-containing protein [Myxococcales bacterium]|nr:PIN domain-containing protein [Myxococcales bacterium]
MIVLDASVVIELLLGLPAAAAIGRRLAGGPSLHAPHLLDIEVAHVLRRYHAVGELGSARAAAAFDSLAALGIVRHSHQLLLPRIWQLRHNLTAYDAAYLALAEVLAAPLLTLDAGLAAAPGHRARIELIEG